jgi:hypothetical protein
LRRLGDEAAWIEWIERYRRLWDARFHDLNRIVAELKLEEAMDEK